MTELRLSGDMQIRDEMRFLYLEARPATLYVELYRKRSTRE